MQRVRSDRVQRAVWAWLVFAACFTLFPWSQAFAPPAAFAEEPAMQHHDPSAHDHMGMQMNGPADPAEQARLEAKIKADKKESEFNHHLAGLLVAVAGVFILFQGALVSRWNSLKYLWPATFLVSGLFVLVWSDTELWPFGQRYWLEALQNNPEVLQHKTFAVLLLMLGWIEWQRVRKVLTSLWSAWVFPIIAIAGSIILIFHHHEGGMVGEHHMETMARIQSEHFSYTLCGFGIGLSKGLSEVNGRLSRIFGKLWPSLMIGLGLLLMFYRE